MPDLVVTVRVRGRELLVKQLKDTLLLLSWILLSDILHNLPRHKLW